jgi:hypothetical protein
MTVVVLLALWTTATGAQHWYTKAPLFFLAIGLLCLQSYWLGTGDVERIEFISTVSVTILGTIIGLTMNCVRGERSLDNE